MNKYVDLKINGVLFPSWISANFKKYHLPKIMEQEGVDPCSVEFKTELKQYQVFISKYLDYNSPYKNILLYYGVGAGKTGTAINVYNMLYNYTPGWNVFLLIKASLRDNWLHEIKKWLKKDEYDYRFRNIIFINYDSPFADKTFMDAIKNVDNSKKSLYIIEEAHNFIRNVYSNISSDKGKRAQNIYDYIIQDQRENPDTRVLALTATPVVNYPFELALLFNLLRPGIFPKSETEFNSLFISGGSYQTINKVNKNLFQRRITGLVSYYAGATKDVFATKTYHYVDVPMSAYHEDIYNYFEDIEDKIAMKMKFSGKTSQVYKAYTRQACNFVFPAINQKVNGENRPRPSKFKISVQESTKILEAKDVVDSDNKQVSEYMKALKQYITTYESYINDIMHKDEKSSQTIFDDINTFIKKYDGDFVKFLKSSEIKSKTFEAMHMCGPKMLNIIFNIYNSKGPVVVYSNYVYMEGLELLKVYLKLFGYYNFMDTKELVKNKVGFVEFHGGIKKFEDRTTGMMEFNKPQNKLGEFIKVILISPAGSEGLSLSNVRQIHILEPYWNVVRIQQIIGRGIRLCSHKDLPIEDRHVDIYFYKVSRTKTTKYTTDQYIEEYSRTKESLNQSFLDAIQEVAIDCNLNKEHNMLSQEYKCFQFNDSSSFDKHIKPAFKDNIYEDIKYSSGSNSINSLTLKIKVMKITAVMKLSKDGEEPKYDEPKQYWYYSKYHTVYDLDLHYPVGKIELNNDDIPVKTSDSGHYVINYVVPIPVVTI